MEREALNKFNIPEMVSALLVALEKAGLEETVKQLKKLGVPKMLNDAWMERAKTASFFDWRAFGNTLSDVVNSKFNLPPEQISGELFRDGTVKYIFSWPQNTQSSWDRGKLEQLIALVARKYGLLSRGDHYETMMGKRIEISIPPNDLEFSYPASLENTWGPLAK